VPLVRTIGAGRNPSASAVAVWTRVVTPAGDAAEFSDALLVYAMPRLTFQIQQLAGPLGATVVPLFAVRSIDGIGIPAPDWLPLDAPVVVNPALTNPTRLQYMQPARLIRLQFQRPAGQPTTLRIVLSGSL